MAGGTVRVPAALCFPARSLVSPHSNEISLEIKRVSVFELGKRRNQQNLTTVVEEKNKKQMAEQPEASQVPLDDSVFFIIISNLYIFCITRKHFQASVGRLLMAGVRVSRGFGKHRAQTSHVGKALGTEFGWDFQISRGRKLQEGSATPLGPDQKG